MLNFSVNRDKFCLSAALLLSLLIEPEGFRRIELERLRLLIYS